MDFPNEIGQLGLNLQNYLIAHGAALPEFTRNKVIEAAGSPSPVDRIVKVGEALYAAPGLSDEGKTLVAQLISFAAMNGWHGLADDNRGGRIVMAMRRDLGDEAPGGEWPDMADVPEPLSMYQEPVEEVVEA